MKRYILLSLFALVTVSGTSYARDIDYRGGEITVYVQPGEPTQISFPEAIATGFRKKPSALSLDRNAEDLVIFANENLVEDGEALIVRLQDGRSYSVRVAKATSSDQRDAAVRIFDDRSSIIGEADEVPEHISRTFPSANPGTVPGFMKELILAAEFGKQNIPGYRTSDRHRGEVVMSDGTMTAKIDRIFMGPNLWGYVLDTENLLDSGQRINPAAFRLHGTRAISMSNWELAPKPLTAEQQLAGKHRTKVYVITRARRAN